MRKERDDFAPPRIDSRHSHSVAIRGDRAPGPLLDIPIQPDPADGQMRHRNGKRRLADKLRDPGVAEVKHAADLRPGHHIGRTSE